MARTDRQTDRQTQREIEYEITFPHTQAVRIFDHQA